MNWFKLYAEIIHDPKILRLTLAQRWGFIEVLCLAAQRDAGGNTGMSVDDIALVVRRRSIRKTIPSLVDAGLAQINEIGHVVVAKWQERQQRHRGADDGESYVKSNAQRAREFRKRRAQKTAPVTTVTDPVTAPVTTVTDPVTAPVTTVTDPVTDPVTTVTPRAREIRLEENRKDLFFARNVSPPLQATPLQATPEKKILSVESQQPPPPEIPAWLPARDWEEFREHRAQRGKPLTPLAEKKCLERLAALRASGSDPVRVIAQAIEGGYTSLAPVVGAGAANSGERAASDSSGDRPPGAWSAMMRKKAEEKEALRRLMVAAGTTEVSLPKDWDRSGSGPQPFSWTPPTHQTSETDGKTS
ncbi:MAG: hypothetical protein HQL82_16015 [Magnetococcales bacterium]|nr:hypothetical protein [Magnetococcales bacterium]